MMELKSFQIQEIKSLDAQTDTFTGYASTWDKDLDDDVITKGAFTETLAESFPNGGAHIPIHWEHKSGSPYDVIGETLSAVEDDHGLLVTGRIDTSTDEGKRAYELMKSGLIHQMSIGFIPLESEWVTPIEDDWHGYRKINKAKLFEISVVQVAANQGAEIVEVKSGRRISKESKDKLQAAIDALTSLIEDERDDDDDKPDEPDLKAEPDEQDSKKPDTPEDSLDKDDKPAENGKQDPKPDKAKEEKKSFDHDMWAKEYQEISAYFGR